MKRMKTMFGERSVMCSTMGKTFSNWTEEWLRVHHKVWSCILVLTVGMSAVTSLSA